jgi:hypothetical protein
VREGKRRVREEKEMKEEKEGCGSRFAATSFLLGLRKLNTIVLF